MNLPLEEQARFSELALCNASPFSIAVTKGNGLARWCGDTIELGLEANLAKR